MEGSEKFTVKTLEKPEGSKTLPASERPAIFRWFRDRGLPIYLTAALSVVAPFKTERLEAAEISPNATWIDGVETLHRESLNNVNESYGLFLKDNDTGRTKWIIGKEGKPTFVDIEPRGITKPVELEIAGHDASSITLCDIHTHPLSNTYYGQSDKEILDIRQGKQVIAKPPSGDIWQGDISVYRHEAFELAIDPIRNKGITVEISQGVVDPAGITYHRLLKDQEIRYQYPNFHKELEESRVALREWENTIRPLVDSLDIAKLNKLYELTEYDYKSKLDNTYSEQEMQEIKRQVIINTIIFGVFGYNIAQELLADHSDGQKLLQDFKTKIFDKRFVMDEASYKWRIKSLTVSPEQLTSTEEYAKLREAYVQNGTKIRFVPHSQIPNEPPCAGTDYKP